MSTNTNARNDASTNQPTHIAYHVRDRNGGNAVWTRIGAAWQHSDGNGFSLQLDVAPFDGRITLRARTDEKVA